MALEKYRTTLPPEGEPIPPAEVEFNEEMYLRFWPGSYYRSPEGEKYKVSAIDFMSGGVVFEKPYLKEYYFAASEELTEFKRLLQEEDYKNDEFLHKEGWSATVVGCDTYSNKIILENQRREQFKVSYEKFISEFSEQPPDLYAPFVGSYLLDKERQGIYVADIDLVNKKARLQKCKLIDEERPSNPGSWLPLPDNEYEVSFEEMGKEYISMTPPAEEVLKDLPSYERMSGVDTDASIIDAEFEVIDDKPKKAA